MNKVHGPLNPAQSSREASFFPVQGNLSFLVSYRYTALRGLSGKSTSTSGPGSGRPGPLLCTAALWYTVTVAACNTKGP